MPAKSPRSPGLLQNRGVQVILVGVIVCIGILSYMTFTRGTFSSENERFYHSEKLEKDVEKRHVESRSSSDKQTNDPVLEEDLLPEEVQVVITFTKAKQNPNLQDKFKTCVQSILQLSSVNLAFHIIGDEDSQKIAEKILTESGRYSLVSQRVVPHDIDKMAKDLHGIVEPMQKYFSYKPGAYYSDSLFFLSIAIHRVMPDNMHKVIMLDSDLKFKADIADLYNIFNSFKDTEIMAIARDGQPVYRHTFWEYRSKNPETRVGEPPPNGLTGFNSGVLLLDLDRMRKSELYNNLIDPSILEKLTSKYKFKGHLGDQDFFTLIGMDHEELFHVLPCNWNRQLCQWWRDKGYEDVFDLYFKCEGKINIYHGNCNTPIPD